ncbi:unnamed protein product [Toxocara canis]|uniref:RRM domain-containing protein n=1 Tax=Toxocara canis TaxID=6265 RepID=A0A183U6Z7_TOXCA|nr:unnamed protein product [Toxocara canis]
MGSRRECRIFIGNLPPDVTQRDLEDIFDKYGHICYTDIKFTRGVPFAFIEFDDPRYIFISLVWSLERVSSPCFKPHQGRSELFGAEAYSMCSSDA